MKIQTISTVPASDLVGRVPLNDRTSALRDAMPFGVRIYRVQVETEELQRLTNGCLEAWSLWRGVQYLGLFSRDRCTWTWNASDREYKGRHGGPDHLYTGPNEPLIVDAFVDEFKNYLDHLDQTVTDSGKTPA